jgi:NAD(P)-dependent dehydrogenase (short-subunit alcohol dehydrogenase family)
MNSLAQATYEEISMDKHDLPMIGKTCMVTGGTSGIGLATAKGLADQGAQVIIIGRNVEKGARIASYLKAETGNDAIESMTADLSSQKSIVELANEFKGNHQNLHVLVNNAGAITLSRSTTLDGLEMTFALNHIAYFLLTNLLLDTLRKSAPARVINVSSVAHEKATLEFDNLQGERSYRGYQAYGRSKLANVLFTYRLSEVLAESGITVNAFHPGLVATKFLLNNGLKGRLMNVFLGILGISPEAGAQTAIYLATSPEAEGVTGQYFYKKRPVPSSMTSYDKGIGEQLWRISTDLTGLESHIKTFGPPTNIT